MEDYLIVDGYNMIGAWPELKRLKDISLEEARDKLIDYLADYQAFSGMRLYVVFDAYQVPGRGGKYEQSKLNLIFTKEKETADEAIERLVKQLKKGRRRIYVATSDLVEQHVIFGSGALRISAGELWVEVSRNEREISKKITNPEKPGRNTFDSKLSNELRNLFEHWRRQK
ncbi:MAG: RNA-binding protein [Paenibacillus sp. RIFOXYA1_FULL_44_5]|nr:MAG: RNA-binding protein [Paenibacillus sp. RIFOXYA1_FULL_44_5]